MTNETEVKDSAILAEVEKEVKDSAILAEVEKEVIEVKKIEAGISGKDLDVKKKKKTVKVEKEEEVPESSPKAGKIKASLLSRKIAENVKAGRAKDKPVSIEKGGFNGGDREKAFLVLYALSLTDKEAALKRYKGLPVLGVRERLKKAGIEVTGSYDNAKATKAFTEFSVSTVSPTFAGFSPDRTGRFYIGERNNGRYLRVPGFDTPKEDRV
jgi:hypothetical protein